MSGLRFQIGWYNGWSPEERLATVPIQREAIRTGRLIKPTSCSICHRQHEWGTSRSVWLHDENYADPLAAYAICRGCHRLLHQRFEQPEAWHSLVRQHGDGTNWFERLSMDPESQHRPFDQTYPDGLPPASAR